jgi:hypothetical protein
MRLLVISAFAIVTAASIAAASDVTGYADIALEMRAALEAHAPLPASLPDLPDDGPPPRDTPGRRPTPGAAAEQEIATTDQARKGALERVIDHAANLASEVLGRERDLGDSPDAATSARAAAMEAEAAVRLARGAEARGTRPPVPLWDSPLPGSDPDAPAPPTRP